MEWIKSDETLINLDKVMKIEHETYENYYGKVDQLLWLELVNGKRFPIEFTKEYDTLEKCLDYLGIDLKVLNNGK